MTCTVVRQRLLTSERPDHPGLDDSRHLAECPACRAWLRRLVRLERQLPLLRVPTPPPPPALLGRILAGAARPHTPLVRPALPHTDQRRIREGGRQKLALAFSLAATLALFTFGWWAWPPRAEAPRPVSRPPYETAIQDALRPARTPRQRMDALANLADTFLAEVRTFEDDPQRVAELAGYYIRLTQEDLLRLAKEVPAAEREGVLLEAAVRFHQADSKASRLADAWAGNHAATAKSLRRIAVAAREAESKLRLLALA